MSVGSPVDVGDAVETISAQLASVGFVGIAALGCIVAVAAFRWIRSEMLWGGRFSTVSDAEYIAAAGLSGTAAGIATRQSFTEEGLEISRTAGRGFDNGVGVYGIADARADMDAVYADHVANGGELSRDELSAKIYS